MWHECCMKSCLFALVFYIWLRPVHLCATKQKQRPCQPADACSSALQSCGAAGAQPGFQTLLTTWSNSRRANRTSRAASQGASSSSGSLTAAAGLRLTRQGSPKQHSSILRGGLCGKTVCSHLQTFVVEQKVLQKEYHGTKAVCLHAFNLSS